MKLNYKQSITLITDIIVNTKNNAIYEDGSEFWINDRLLYFTLDRARNVFQIIDRGPNSRIQDTTTFYLTTKDFEDLLKLFTDRTNKYKGTYDVPEYMITDSVKRELKIESIGIDG